MNSPASIRPARQHRHRHIQETDKLAMNLMKRHPELRLTKVVVSKRARSAGFELAAKEFSELMCLRGAGRSALAAGPLASW